MYLVYLREGDDSIAWEQALRIVDAVVWSVNVEQDPVQLKRLRSIGPRLIRNLQKGFEDVSYDAVTVKEWLKALHPVFTNIIKGEAFDRTEVVITEPQEVVKFINDDQHVLELEQSWLWQ